MRFAYLDPPYPGKARRYYQHETTYGGEVDHVELIARVVAAGYDGWALSTSEDALRWVLPLTPEATRTCPWVKPIGVSSLTFGPHNTWEPLLVCGGRKLRPGFRDWISTQPARFGGSLPGRKPLAFCGFLFQQLGMLPGDTLDDWFPGSGIVGRAWAELCRAAQSDASARSLGDASGPGWSDEPSQEYSGDASPGDDTDGPSARYPCDG